MSREKLYCFVCGNELEGEELDEELEHPRSEDGKTRCDKCYFEAYFDRCVICDEWIPKEETKYFVIIDEEAYETGYYEILDRPFYSSNIIGGDEIFPYAVKKVGGLRGVEEEENGYVCKKCAIPEHNK